MRYLLIAVLWVSVAHADPQPWAVGVTEAQKAEAHQHLDAGNALFLDRKYAEALEQYRAAVAAWDHPAIRFNIVRCLIQLDKPVEAFDNLQLALKYGHAPLQDDVYNEALAYQKLLGKQIGDVSIACTQPGVKLTLDGQPLATCPAKEARRVSPGPHQVVGTKPGFMPKTVDVVVIGGQQHEVTVALDPIEKGARIEHRWAGYVPYVVFGAGFAVAGFGALLDLSAASDMDSYTRFVNQRCLSHTCTPDQLADVQSIKDRAQLKSTLGVGVMIAGGAGIVTGAVMMYLNRGRTVYPEVAPLPGGAALSFAGSW